MDILYPNPQNAKVFDPNANANVFEPRYYPYSRLVKVLHVKEVQEIQEIHWSIQEIQEVQEIQRSSNHTRISWIGSRAVYCHVLILYLRDADGLNSHLIKYLLL